MENIVDLAEQMRDLADDALRRGDPNADLLQYAAQALFKAKFDENHTPGKMARRYVLRAKDVLRPTKLFPEDRLDELADLVRQIDLRNERFRRRHRTNLTRIDDERHQRLNLIIQGVIQDVLSTHPDYFTDKGKEAIKVSLGKRLSGALRSLMKARPE